MAYRRDRSAFSLSVKIVIDMNLSPEWVSVFKIAGYQAVHWSSVGDIKAKDSTIMAWAVNNNYMVFTHDLDFGTLLAISEVDTPSVIQVRTQDILPSKLGKTVLDVLKQFQSELETGALVTINEARAKVRILPIRRNH
jgi:predicted nuclease of predicted toxin-antitoxin system